MGDSDSRVQSQVDRLVVTNDETQRNRVVLRLLALFSGGLGAFLILAPAWSWAHVFFRTPGDLANIVVGFVAGTFFVFRAFHIWDQTSPISWRIDDEGIEYDGPLGTRKSLRWSEVERVRWDVNGVRLKGHGNRITLRWNQLSPGPRGRAAETIAQALRPDFELPRGSSGIGGLLLRLGYYLGAMLVGLVGAPLLIGRFAPLVEDLLLDRTILAYTIAATFTVCVALTLLPLLIWNARNRWIRRRPR